MMRLTTRKVAPREVQHSYYVQFLRWFATKLWDRAEWIVERRFES